MGTIAPSEQAQREAEEALGAAEAAEQAQEDSAIEQVRLDQEDLIATFSEDQRDTLNEAPTAERYAELVMQFANENERAETSDGAEEDPGAKLRREIDEAHERAGTTPPPIVGNVEDDEEGSGPEHQFGEPDRVEQLAGGAPMQQTINGDEEEHPVAADDTGRAQPPAEIILRGSGRLGVSVGGKKPTGATLRLTGGKFGIAEGQLDKGETRTVVTVATVNKVAFVDKVDSKTRQVTDCDRDHSARIENAHLIPAGHRIAVVPDDTPTLDMEIELS